jgi:4-aminobutyrate aminotransferase/(S)-3-amino-2-methylpropionate transaminase
LNELTPGDFHKKTMLANSGAEAVENAVKIARHATGRPAVIALDNAFHGRTLLTMTLTSKVKPYKLGFGPFAPEVYRMPNAYCYRCPFGLRYPACGAACADYLEEFFVGHVAPEQTAAVIVEPIQGEGGFVTPPPEYFSKLQAICRKYGIVLVIDEIQTAMGRTGKLFAIEHWKKLVKLCYEKGLVLIACGNHGNVIRTLMPLVITDEQLDRGFAILESALQELSRER